MIDNSRNIYPLSHCTVYTIVSLSPFLFSANHTQFGLDFFIVTFSPLHQIVLTFIINCKKVSNDCSQINLTRYSLVCVKEHCLKYTARAKIGFFSVIDRFPPPTGHPHTMSSHEWSYDLLWYLAAVFKECNITLELSITCPSMLHIHLPQL